MAASEYDENEPGTWREAALHFRAENKRLQALLAERDAEVARLLAEQGVLVDAPALAVRERDAAVARAERAEADRDEWHDKAMVMAYAVRDQVSLAETHIIARQVIEHDAALAAASEGA